MLTALAIPLDLTGSVTVSDRTEVRARAPGTSGPCSIDVETVIKGGLTLGSRRLRFALEYAPRLSLWDAGTAAAQSTVAHTGQAHAEWSSRRVRLSLDEVGSYGKTNLAASSPSPGPDGQPPHADLVPSSQVLQFASSTTTLAAGLTLSRWTIAARAGYQISGGADADARRSLPLLAGPFGSASAGYAISRVDHAVATLTASETTSASGPDAVLVDVSLSHRRRWSPATETWITAGVSGGRVTVAPLASSIFAVYPVAEVGLARRSIASTRVSALASARLAPMVSQLTGLVDTRAQVTLGASYPRERLTAGVLLSASRSMPGSTAPTGSVVSGELHAGYGVTPRVAIDAGVRYLWQRPEAAGADISMGTLFVGATLRAPPARL